MRRAKASRGNQSHEPWQKINLSGGTRLKNDESEFFDDGAIPEFARARCNRSKGAKTVEEWRG